jgi:hypothetical protein
MSNILFAAALNHMPEFQEYHEQRARFWLVIGLLMILPWVLIYLLHFTSSRADAPWFTPRRRRLQMLVWIGLALGNVAAIWVAGYHFTDYPVEIRFQVGIMVFLCFLTVMSWFRLAGEVWLECSRPKTPPSPAAETNQGTPPG